MQWSLHSWTLQSPERISRRDALLQTGLTILLQKLTCHLKPYRLQGFSSLACHSRGLLCTEYCTVLSTSKSLEATRCLETEGAPAMRRSQPLLTSSLQGQYPSGMPAQPLQLLCQVTQPSPACLHLLVRIGGSVPSLHTKASCTIAE